MYLKLSIQTSSTRVLTWSFRGHTRQMFRDLVEKITTSQELQRIEQRRGRREVLLTELEKKHRYERLAAISQLSL